MADITGILITITVTYIAIMFIIPSILPNYSFINLKIKKTKKLRDFARRFKDRNKEKTLRNIYMHVVKTYDIRRRNFFYFKYIFYYNAEKLINRKIFLPCYLQNFVLKTLLINTGQFSEKDINKKLNVAFIPVVILHQYLIVDLNKKAIKVDPFRRVFKEITHR